jgi:hypothetical protein
MPCSPRASALGRTCDLGGWLYRETQSDPPPTQAPSPTSPSPTRPPKLPLVDARLEGTYEVKLFVTSNTFDSKPDRDQRWHATPKCPEGPCDSLLNSRVSFGGDVDRQQAGATGKVDVRLLQSARRFLGTKVGFFASCVDQPDLDRWTWRIHVEAAKYVKDVWTVTRWSGTWTRNAEVGPPVPCSRGHLTAVIRGHLIRPDN